ncbi:hypothetical protein V496_00214 [Pseudogymnoascus sp. VKM F-4515 (FW-2607)]|nr:hypothetical protein V496_00214 [Pseudogymnoascus sp. VKM F-4515 (FW-2607)]
MYLTATLALVDMPEFMEVIKVQIPADNIFRDSTSRHNIAYSVVEHKGDIEETQAVQRQGVVPQVAITKEDKKRAEQDKVGRFISGARCRRVHLDQAIDDRFNRARCEEGEEVCDLCGKEDAMVGEADVLQEAYNVKQGQGEEGRQEQAKQQGPSLDSGIDIPPSSGIYSSGSPVARYVPPSSPPIRISLGLVDINPIEGDGESNPSDDESPPPDSSSMISFD